MTRYELRFGASRRTDADVFWQRLQLNVVPMVQWLDITQGIAERGGEIAAALQRGGREPKSPVDPLLAATAIVHGLTLVTRNERDFTHVAGLAVNNWFT
jgi:predicted nucleic acid-binding protein